MVTRRRGSAAQKHAARVAWLTPRVRMYADVPGINDDVTPEGREALDRLCGHLRVLGLFGATTHASQRESVRRLLSELRQARVEHE